MNRADYMAALRRALSVLPEEERANALRYSKNILMTQARKTRRRPSKNSASRQRLRRRSWRTTAN